MATYIKKVGSFLHAIQPVDAQQIFKHSGLILLTKPESLRCHAYTQLKAIAGSS